MIDAVDAPKLLILEKIKKFASVAKMTEPIINNRLVEPEFSTAFIEPLLKNINGNISIAVITESMNTNVIGDTPKRIFWSMVYTSPQVTAADIAYMNPNFFINSYI